MSRRGPTTRRAALALAVLVPAAVLTGRAAGRTGALAAEPAPALPALAIPTDWQPQPTLVAAARAASDADAGPRPRTIAAWGEPVLGCFAAAITLGLASGDDAAKVLGELRTALAAGATVDGWTDDGGVVSAALARPGWHGALRGQGDRPQPGTSHRGRLLPQ